MAAKKVAVAAGALGVLGLGALSLSRTSDRAKEMMRPRSTTAVPSNALGSTTSKPAAAAVGAADVSTFGACKPVVVCGPSGVGKSTLIERLTEEFPEDFGFSVDYTFTTVDDMRARIARGEFIEHAEVHGNLYGTSKAAVERVAAQNRVCVLDIDVQGVRSVKAAGMDVAAYVFVAPPSIDALRTRLEKRGTDKPEVIKRRLADAEGEISAGKTLGFDEWIVNEDVEKAYSRFKAITNDVRCKCAESRRGATAGAAKQ